MVACITIVLPLLASIVRAVIASRIRPVPFGAEYVDRATFRRIVNYSSSTFSDHGGGRLKFKDRRNCNRYHDVGGDHLLQYRQPYRGLRWTGSDHAAQVFVPMSSQSEAKGDMNRLRKIFVVGNRACAFIIFSHLRDPDHSRKVGDRGVDGKEVRRHQLTRCWSS